MRAVEFALTSNAGARTRQRLATLLGDFFTAHLAVLKAFATRQATARRIKSILDAVVDLLLNGAIGRPAIGHA